MKHFTKPGMLAGLCALGGVGALCLQLWFLHTGVDDRGLLVTDHPGNILSFILTALVLLPTLYFGLKVPTGSCRSAAPSPFGALGAVLSGVGFAYSAQHLVMGPVPLITLITGLLGLLSALCALWVAVCRFRGQRVHPGVASVIVLFLILLPVQFYQDWSSEPQLPRYFFQLLGSLSLLLWVYNRFALDADVGDRRTCLIAGCCSIFFCTVSLAESYQRIFYLTMALWLVLDSLPLRPRQVSSHEAA